MTIVFIHPHKAFLPEIDAYSAFFNAHGIHTIVVKPGGDKEIEADVEWHFMGIHRGRKKSRMVIHEYASASTGFLPGFKDRLKKLINIKPDYRIFLNEYTRSAFAFNDGVPGGLRDHGTIPADKNNVLPVEKKYDFIYIGTTDKKRKLDGLFDQFVWGNMKDHTLLVLSRDYQQLAAKLSASTNIIFKGPVPAAEVYAFVKQARYGINYMPGERPYNLQASAKLLDYLACGIPVISTRYTWVEQFQREHGGNFFYLEKDLSNFNWEEITQFNYSFPDMSDFTWEKQILKSGVLEFLLSI